MKAIILSAVGKKIFKFRILNTFAVVSFLLLFILIILNWEFISIMQDFDDWLVSVLSVFAILMLCLLADTILALTISSKIKLLIIETILLIMAMYYLMDYI